MSTAAEKIAKHIRTLLDTVQKQDARINTLERMLMLPGDPTTQFASGNPFVSPPQVYAITVTDVSSSAMTVTGVRLTTDGTTFAVNTLTESNPITAIAPTSLTLPEVGDVVPIQTLGSTGDNVVFGIVSAGGGGGGSGCYPAQVLSREGHPWYEVSVFKDGTGGAATVSSATVLQLDSAETIPAYTWVMVSQAGDGTYYFTIPMWLDG